MSVPDGRMFGVAIAALACCAMPTSYAYLPSELPTDLQPVHRISHELSSDIIWIDPNQLMPSSLKRYVILGAGEQDRASWNPAMPGAPGTGMAGVSVMSPESALSLASRGYHITEDMRLDTHGSAYTIPTDLLPEDAVPDSSRLRLISGLDGTESYNATGRGIVVAVVDTGVDFSNPDIRHSLARDERGHPVMIDPDGHGLVLTNATFYANIARGGAVANHTGEPPVETASSVYVNSDGVFLDVNRGGRGITISVYNTLFPDMGSEPVIAGTLNNDMRIGTDRHTYIKSMSGIYRLGVIYQGSVTDGSVGLRVVPVLMVDSVEPGVYDTVIPDMSTSWKDFATNTLKMPNLDYDFDFTDEKPIVLGSGNEFLLYDSDGDGLDDYSVGAVGARVLDVYNATSADRVEFSSYLDASSGMLLPALDPDGAFFGIMSDTALHGTASAATIASRGQLGYDIYNDTKLHSLPGVAPDASILPVKALWLGDVTYGWLWSAGFDQVNGTWQFTGDSRADILSNSWGISRFPNFQTLPGFDPLSLVSVMLSTPHSLDEDYPGVLMVQSAGNSGHGYGTIGMPVSSLGLSVGATTNNVFVGYGPFLNQPRFGNTTDHLNEVVDFSSRGPTALGTVAPDLLSLGAYGFVPSSMTRTAQGGQFTVYGGTSMAAPMVSGIAAVLMEEMKEQLQDYDPFVIKNILMSTATDRGSDPFVQGAGQAHLGAALDYIHGNGGFMVHNDASYLNVRKVLNPSMESFNYTDMHLEAFGLPPRPAPVTSWFAGHMLAGERTTATFTITNPTDREISVAVQPVSLSLLDSSSYSGTTDVRLPDPVLDIPNAYVPNYVRLYDIRERDDTAEFFDDRNPIPRGASLMVVNVNYLFDDFMNSTSNMYADDLRASSVYVYDWLDANEDEKITSSELSLVNRGGSWGTVQEVRISDPEEKFEGVPLVGVYPIPDRYSYWQVDPVGKSDPMDYTVTASYYGHNEWPVIWPARNTVTVPPDGTSEVDVTLVVPESYRTGVYQGYLKFEGALHKVIAPVSFAVKHSVTGTDSSLLIEGARPDGIMYGSGHTRGAFDMTDRYMAGDWMLYYIDVQDDAIDSAAVEISWRSSDTSLSAFAMDPEGRIIQSSAPSGVFGYIYGWPSNDWLGSSMLSGGGGFYPVKNPDDISTTLYLPINQTGTYTVLAHTVLFGGESVTEPITLAAQFFNIPSHGRTTASAPEDIGDTLPEAFASEPDPLKLVTSPGGYAQSAKDPAIFDSLVAKDSDRPLPESSVVPLGASSDAAAPETDTASEIPVNLGYDAARSADQPAKPTAYSTVAAMSGAEDAVHASDLLHGDQDPLTLTMMVAVAGIGAAMAFAYRSLTFKGHAQGDLSRHSSLDARDGASGTSAGGAPRTLPIHS